MAQQIPSLTLGASAAIGTGLQVPLGNVMPVRLVLVFVIYTASATVGNRSPVIQIKAPPPGQVIWYAAQGTSVTAGQAVNVQAGDGVPPIAIAGPPILQTLPLPSNLILPIGASLAVVDLNNVDPADTALVRFLTVN